MILTAKSFMFGEYVNLLFARFSLQFAGVHVGYAVSTTHRFEFFSASRAFAHGLTILDDAHGPIRTMVSVARSMLP